MRTSCHACAFSKLRCSGDKPSCARCAKKGLPCEYMAAKRGGRKPTVNKATGAVDQHVFGALHAASHAQGTPQGRAATQAVMYSTPSQHSANTTSNTTSTSVSPVLRPTPEGSLSPFQATYQTMPSYFDPTMLSSFDQPLASTSTATDSDLGDYFPLSQDLDMLTADFLPMDFDTSAADFQFNASADPMDTTACDLFADFISAPGQKAPCGPNTDFQLFPAARSAKSSPSCLVRALELLRQYSPSSCQDSTSSTPSLPIVIAQNGATIEAASALLECPCSRDGYQLVLVALIVFKALTWYNAAVRQESHSRQTSVSNKTPGGIASDGEENPKRAAAQAVLVESHRVRKLIEQTSLRLRARIEADEAEQTTGGGGFALPFSAAMYSQLDAALMGQLRVLSLDMIDRMKNH
jgi:hypothetical protein